MDITKILLSIIVAIMIVTTTNATTMCVTDDNNSIILDPNIDGTGYTNNDAAKTWTATFRFGTVSGIATCNSTSGTYGKAYPQYNFDNNHASSTGVYCWCRMTSPVRSAWVYEDKLNSASECGAVCTSRCGRLVQGNLTYRGGVFGSAGQ
jgi:hypothetical protein